VASLLFQSTLAGLLCGGVAIGPGGFHLIREFVQVETLAQLGATCLLFGLGLVRHPPPSPLICRSPARSSCPPVLLFTATCPHAPVELLTRRFGALRTFQRTNLADQTHAPLDSACGRCPHGTFASLHSASLYDLLDLAQVVVVCAFACFGLRHPGGALPECLTMCLRQFAHIAHTPLNTTHAYRRNGLGSADFCRLRTSAVAIWRAADKRLGAGRGGFPSRYATKGSYWEGEGEEGIATDSTVEHH
jgi:hypothetical protein